MFFFVCHFRFYLLQGMNLGWPTHEHFSSLPSPSERFQTLFSTDMSTIWKRKQTKASMMAFCSISKRNEPICLMKKKLSKRKRKLKIEKYFLNGLSGQIRTARDGTIHIGFHHWAMQERCCSIGNVCSYLGLYGEMSYCSKVFASVNRKY